MQPRFVWWTAHGFEIAVVEFEADEFGAPGAAEREGGVTEGDGFAGAEESDELTPRVEGGLGIEGRGVEFGETAPAEEEVVVNGGEEAAGVIAGELRGRTEAERGRREVCGLQIGPRGSDGAEVGEDGLGEVEEPLAGRFGRDQGGRGAGEDTAGGGLQSLVAGGVGAGVLGVECQGGSEGGMSRVGRGHGGGEECEDGVRVVLRGRQRRDGRLAGVEAQAQQDHSPEGSEKPTAARASKRGTHGIGKGMVR